MFLPTCVHSSRQSIQTPQPRQPLSSDVMATPTAMTSQGTTGRRWSVGSVEETTQSRTLVQSPAITVTSADTPTPRDAARSATAAVVPGARAASITQTDADRDGTEATLASGIFITPVIMQNLDMTITTACPGESLCNKDQREEEVTGMFCPSRFWRRRGFGEPAAVSATRRRVNAGGQTSRAPPSTGEPPV